jgi:sugar phosphate isomerase/epimerase
MQPMPYWHHHWLAKNGRCKTPQGNNITADKMKKIFLFSLLVFTQQLLAQKVKNDFFTLHNIIRGDSVYNSFEKQVELIKGLGFDGIEINQIENFEGMKAALGKFQFTGSYLYVKLVLDEPIDDRLESAISQLNGAKTIIAPYILTNAKSEKVSTHERDEQLVAMIKKVSDWAMKSNLQVAIYPHFGFYVERTDHALALVKQINRKNVGLTFNLCHWLATTGSAERATLKNHLKELMPYLKMITISGANDVITDKKTIWDDYILPLGEGSFDTYGLLKYFLKELKYKNPIGVQCYNIKGNKVLLAKSTINVWKAYRSKLDHE